MMGLYRRKSKKKTTITLSSKTPTYKQDDLSMQHWL
jgi:hypothetical protein